MILVLLNQGAKSGSGADISEKISHLFAEHQCPAQIRIARDGGELRFLANEAAEGPNPIVVAGGGDGTINTVASALFGKGKALGVLPLGTHNHFARDAKIPLDLKGAVNALAEGHVAEIDVGQVNDRIFLNNSSIGLYPEIVRRRIKQQETFNRRKWSALLRAFIDAVKSSQFLHVHIRTAGEELRRVTPFVFVGNNPYDLDGFGIGGRPSLECGQLCLWLARRARPAGLVRLGIRAIFGRLSGARDFEAHCGTEFRVTPHKARLRVAVDGETYFMDSPLSYRSCPRSLRVVVPAAP